LFQSNTEVSAPAFFAVVVVWRVRRLRRTEAQLWGSPLQEGFGTRLFEAAGLPIVLATLLLAVGLEIVPAVAGASEGELVSVRAMARSIVTVALVVGLLATHRRLGKGIGQLMAAGFFIWSIHLAIGIAVPFMVGWTSYLPVIGQYAPQRSGAAAHLLFDLAVAAGAWAAAREKARDQPLFAAEGDEA
jgi:hypothetical protein